MAVPYFIYSATTVYFDNGMVIPYPISYSRNQSIGRAENKKIKVYDHGMGGTYKRSWNVKAEMDNSASSNHKFSDWIAFLTSTVIHAKYKFTFYDADGASATVRIIDNAVRKLRCGVWEVSIELEEDY